MIYHEILKKTIKYDIKKFILYVFLSFNIVYIIIFLKILKIKNNI